jgi:Tfp pilus assembly protein FimV
MAMRREEVIEATAVVYRFPTVRVRAAARRRKRAVVRRRLGLAVVATVVVVSTLLGGGSAPASRRGSPRSIVTRPGQTLWEIAGRHAPDGIDTRAYVDALVELNDIEGALQPGVRLRLPHP